MSTFLSSARVRTLRPTSGLPRPRLTIVPKVAARASRIPFALLVVSVLGGGLVGLLLLNTTLQRGAYEVTALQQTSDALSLRQQNLETEVSALQSPQRIGARAVRLGMVAGDSPAFLSLETGKVIGVPQAGSRAHRPTIALTGTLLDAAGTTSAGRTQADGSPQSSRSGGATAETRHTGKLVPIVPGGSATMSSGAVKVAKPQDGHDDRHRDNHRDKHRNKPDAGNERHRPTGSGGSGAR
jgi:hypothetical protein